MARLSLKKFPHYQQRDSKDCGPTSIKIIAKFYKKNIQTEYLRQLCETTRLGSNLLKVSHASEKIGFRTIGVKINLTTLNEAPLPCILHWNHNHFVVLYKIKKGFYYISDPAHGKIKYNKKEFLGHWVGIGANEIESNGVALLYEPTPRLYDLKIDKKSNDLNFDFLSKYLLKYKAFLWQLIIGLTASSLIQLIFPFLTQSIVDVGIVNSDINFIYLILIAQMSLFLGRVTIDILRSWILLHLSTRINISLVSDFFIKLMDLPISYFDSKMTGDILQRINDHKRIENILTSSSLSVLFSLINLVVFSVVLLIYSSLLFSVFIAGSILYFLWIKIFLNKREDIDYKRFAQVSEEQSKVIELINGMQEIKLHNAEKQKRWDWEFVQARLFKLSMKGLALEQFQSVGSTCINEFKNIAITILAAKLVIEGEITLGMMLSITYIVGQLNTPISRLINFIRELQDAKISFARLAEIHDLENEETENHSYSLNLELEEMLTVQNLNFRYQGSDKEILKNLNFNIPHKKITAIEGTSGSGKTTLMKILLKYYNIEEGDIYYGNTNLRHVSHSEWRSKCGVVMQEGYIFNESIAKNIAVGETTIDKAQLLKAVHIANIKGFIESLPLRYNTMIGAEGLGLSTGQKQRILIARAIYKDPKILFFDEATSALDSKNEKIIMNNLNEYFKDRTVFIIAHRLSTVKNAHQIILLENGEILEKGTHKELVEKGGGYFDLVKNQLELAS